MVIKFFNTSYIQYINYPNSTVKKTTHFTNKNLKNIEIKYTFNSLSWSLEAQINTLPELVSTFPWPLPLSTLLRTIKQHHTHLNHFIFNKTNNLFNTNPTKNILLLTQITKLLNYQIKIFKLC